MHNIKLKPIINNLLGRNNLKSEKIVSGKYRFIWIGIPKSATRSILTAFVREPECDLDAYEFRGTIQDLFKKNRNYRRYFKFTFVRNPWSRIVSTYKNKIAKPDKRILQSDFFKYPGLKPGMSFDEFVKFLSSGAGKFDFIGDRHWISQHLFISCRSKIIADYIGKLENLENDFLKVRKILKLPEISLPRLNTRYGWKPEEKRSYPPDYYKKFYSNQTRELIAKRYRKDIKLFNYKF